MLLRIALRGRFSVYTAILTDFASTKENYCCLQPMPANINTKRSYPGKGAGSLNQAGYAL